MAGYLIAVVTFGLAFAFGTIRAVRTRLVLGVGGMLALAWASVLAIAASENVDSREPVPLWFAFGLVALLYAIWCGGLWLGLRVRHGRGRT